MNMIPNRRFCFLGISTEMQVGLIFFRESITV